MNEDNKFFELTRSKQRGSSITLAVQGSMAMESISVQSPSELLTALAAMDIAVPLRTEGRTTEHCERWSICRLLAAIANSAFLSYPIVVVHRDRPDFHIKHGSTDVGVEVTEVIQENDAAIDAYREHNDIDGPFFIKRHRPGDARLKGAELRGAAVSDAPGDGWVGDSVEREWVAAMRAFIEVKAENAKKPGFQLFTERWLLMYDNWSLPGVDREDAVNKLLVSMTSADFGPFQKIWIESPDAIRCISENGVVTRAINDLWAGK